MPLRRQVGTAGFVFHVLNRSLRRSRLFESAGDYRAFLTCAAEAQQRVPIRLLAYCVMPNHFHFVLWPAGDDELAGFMHWLTTTHSKRWHRHRLSTGTGPVYQGRYKAFAVQNDRHFLTVCRYVERNPLRAKLVGRAEQWPWSSLAARNSPASALELSDWPVPRPSDWLGTLNDPESQADLEQVRMSLQRGLPIGEAEWIDATVARLGLEKATRPHGRPRKSGSRL